MKNTLFNKTVNSLKWTSISTVSNIVLQILYTSIMSRLLNPSDFGLVALATSVVSFGNYFASVGLGRALIQKEDLTQEDIRAVFSISLIMGLLISISILALSPFIGYVYPNADTGNLKIVIQVMSINIFLSTLGITAGALLMRNLNFKRTTIILFFATLTQNIVAIALAYLGFGFWSLVVAGVVNSVLTFFTLFYSAPHSIIPIFSAKVYKPILSYGAFLSGNTIIEYFNQTMDIFLIGRFSDAAKVGIYSRVNLLFGLPIHYLTSTLNSVFFPILSRMQDELGKIQESLFRIIMFLSILGLPLAVGVSIAARNVIIVTLGEQWVEGASVLQIYVFARVIGMVTMQSGIICDATANLRPKLIINILYIFIIAFFFYIFRSWGLEGFAMGLLVSEVIRNIMYLVLLRRIINVDYIKYYLILTPAIIVGTAVGVCIYLTTLFCNYAQFNPFSGLALQVCVGGIALATTILFIPLPYFSEELKWLVTKFANRSHSARIAKIIEKYIVFLEKR
ncbi:MAG: lipopolysaccharide biosynthesis protein [Cytophagales bacterium]|nr:MAG: lipopolysaccharide biosynthesis protein [Cytophagales bacterium]